MFRLRSEPYIIFNYSIKNSRTPKQAFFWSHLLFKETQVIFNPSLEFRSIELVSTYLKLFFSGGGIPEEASLGFAKRVQNREHSCHDDCSQNNIRGRPTRVAWSKDYFPNESRTPIHTIQLDSFRGRLVKSTNCEKHRMLTIFALNLLWSYTES